jgi:hypothetical protein
LGAERVEKLIESALRPKRHGASLKERSRREAAFLRGQTRNCLGHPPPIGRYEQAASLPSGDLGLTNSISLLARADEVIDEADYFCFWHKCEVPTVLSNVRFQG